MKLLRLLKDGGFHSGEELGAALGVSRAAVWKQIEIWRTRGLHFDVVPGKGYRLLTPFEAWQEDALRKAISPSASSFLSELIINEQVDSTSDEVMRKLRAGAESGVVCLAEEQLKGRGRRGRSWLSPIGMNFCGSIGWIFPEGITVLEGLSLAIGVVIVKALRTVGAHEIALKWPNDIVKGRAKLGGVLIEIHAESDGPCAVVVGIGLNLHSHPALAAELGRDVVALDQCINQPVSRNQIAGAVLSEVLLLLSTYAEKGFRAYYEEWQKYDSLKNCAVTVMGVTPECEGVVQGVSTDGALVVQTKTGIEKFYGGEVSPRWRDGKE